MDTETSTMPSYKDIFLKDNYTTKNSEKNILLNEEILKNQNKNLKNQIIVLQNRLKIYETECVEKNLKITEDIKNLSNSEKKFQIIIKKYSDENSFLKEQINIMEKNVENLKIEIKNMLKSNLNEKNIKSNLEEKYVKEIKKLKLQNENLFNNIKLYNEKLKQNQINLNNTIQSDINNFSIFINNEIYLIIQWVDTYLSENYDKNFEVPSLFDSLEPKNKNFNLIQFNNLKQCLENSRIKINSILNKSEKELLDKDNILKETELKMDNLNNEIINLKQNIFKLNLEKEDLKKIIEELNNKKEENNKIINNLKETIKINKKMNNDFLKENYNIINDEINEIKKDFNFKAYHDKFLNCGKNYDENIDNINDLLNNSIEKIINFINEFKIDYIKLKNENIKYITEKVNNTFNEFDEEKNKFLILKNKYEEKINNIENENKLLKNQIHNFENNNKIIFNNENKLNEEILNKNNDIYNIEKKNIELSKQIDILKEKYNDLEIKNKQMKLELNNYKNKEEEFFMMKKQNEKLLKDYQRIVNENNNLKNYINKNSKN